MRTVFHVSWELQLTIAFRLVFAFALGGLVGMERTHQQKPAGSRTHALVALAAALFMTISIYGFEGLGTVRDPARLAAQVIAGMGFIGAGTIWKEGSWIRGLTTATTLWISSALGLAVGVGLYVPAILTAGLSYVGLQIYTIKRLLTGRDEWADQMQVYDQLDLGSLKMALESLFAAPIKFATSGADPYIISFQYGKASADPFSLTFSVKERTLSLVLLYIPEGLRRQGYATAVVEILKQWATRHGFQQINLTSKPEVEGLWQKTGFEQVGPGLFTYCIKACPVEPQGQPLQKRHPA